MPNHRGTSSPRIQQALERVRDQRSFLQGLLIDALGWEIPETAERIEDIAFGWTQEELRTADLTKHLIDGSVWQLQALRQEQPWGVFILEFKNADVFTTGRGMTGPLRKVLRGLVPSRRKDPAAKSWNREHLLFVCTHEYEHFRVAYFKSPPDRKTAAPLAAFGWGPDIPNRTACEFNLPELAWPDDPRDIDAWVSQWAGAFDVEKVTKKFYEEYAAAFEQVESQIKVASGIKDPEELRLFTQTLFNRLMFLRFIERKGWLEFNGRHDYLAALMQAGGIGKKSVYQSRLRPLFFEGLAVEGKQQSPAIGKVPFLNGGLFEETELDKKAKDVRDKALSPMLGSGGSVGLFYKFNFTVQESTPLDIEVAVDPEMLGKVFEELVTGRHESGSYYTPRPVVSFMCREALKGYLAAATEISTETVARFVDQHDVAAISISGAKKLASALEGLHAVDPACGSGAYLLGLLHEIVDLYRLLYSDKLKADARELYRIKLHIIEKTLYGVDIDPFATNIAMLRLWLSLAVDCDEPLPLPNLKFKIKTGDSLAGPDPSAMPDLFRDQLQRRADRLVRLKERYQNKHDASKRADFDDIVHEEEEIAKELHAEIGAGVVDWRVHFAEVFAGRPASATMDGEFTAMNKIPGKQKAFEVGKRPGGFDIVLANPPYVRQELIKADKPRLKQVFGPLFSGTADLYVFFYLRALQVLRPDGMLVFISSNKWFRAGYGEKLRAHIATTTTVETIVDFHDLPVFGATAYPMIFIAKKQPPTADHTATLAEPPDLGPPYPDVKEVVAKYGHAMSKTALGRDGTWYLAASRAADRMAKMRSAGPTLNVYAAGQIFNGVKSGLTSAFIIDDDERDALLAHDAAASDFILPFIDGEDVKRWQTPRTGKWIIYLNWTDALPKGAIAKHLKRFEDRLSRRDGVKDDGPCPWYALSRPRSESFPLMRRVKIVYPDIAPSCRFSLDCTQAVTGNTAFAIPTDDLYLLAVLNSQVATTYFTNLSAQVRGGYLRFFRQYVENMPIPNASAADRSAIAALAQKCLDAKGVACEAWENEIDERVAALYGL